MYVSWMVNFVYIFITMYTFLSTLRSYWFGFSSLLEPVSMSLSLESLLFSLPLPLLFVLPFPLFCCRASLRKSATLSWNDVDQSSILSSAEFRLSSSLSKASNSEERKKKFFSHKYHCDRCFTWCKKTFPVKNDWYCGIVELARKVPRITLEPARISHYIRLSFSIGNQTKKINTTFIHINFIACQM